MSCGQSPRGTMGSNPSVTCSCTTKDFQLSCLQRSLGFLWSRATDVPGRVTRKGGKGAELLPMQGERRRWRRRRSRAKQQQEGTSVEEDTPGC